MDTFFVTVLSILSLAEVGYSIPNSCDVKVKLQYFGILILLLNHFQNQEQMEFKSSILSITGFHD